MAAGGGAAKDGAVTSRVFREMAGLALLRGIAFRFIPPLFSILSILNILDSFFVFT